MFASTFQNDRRRSRRLPSLELVVFLGHVVAILAGLYGGGRNALAGTPTEEHPAVALEGLHAYAQKSLDPGETLQLRVSATVPYEMTVRRLHTWIDKFEQMESLHQISVENPRHQPIHPGSSIVFLRGLTPEEVQSGFSLECWVRPWSLKRSQAIFAQATTQQPHGFGLFLDAKGKVVFKIATAGATAETSTFKILEAKESLKKHQWYHLVATWNAGTSSLWIDGELQGMSDDENTTTTTTPPPSLSLPQVPLRLGAAGTADEATLLADIDLAMPVVYRGPLTRQAIAARFADRGQTIPLGGSLLGAWPLDEEAGETIHDRSGNAREGRVINNGTWMIGGPSFESQKVPRFTDYNPLEDTSRGHGIRLASDDLYDCYWEVSHEFTLPGEAPSGVYVAHFQYTWKGTAKDYFVTFIVRPAPRQTPPSKKSLERSPILVLCSTNTWVAYNSSPFPAQGNQAYWSIGGVKSEPGAPHYSCYVDHRAGQPAFQHGLNIPWPGAGPEMLFSPKDVGYSQQLRIERFAHCWLEREGFAYDVISDSDLDENPSLVDHYQVVLISGHSEYWSAKAYQAIESHLDRGKKLVVLSGNTMFWRVDYNRSRSIMECRKKELNSDKRGGTAWYLGWDRPVGELFHSSDKKRGGLLRQCGMPAYRLIGLESIAWWGHKKKEMFDVFHVEDSKHFLFQHPVPIKKKKGDVIGSGKGKALPRGVGHETDVRISRVHAMTKQVPPGWTGTLPAKQKGMSVLASAQHTGEVWTIIDYFGRKAKFHEDIASEVIYWERPAGGQVFNAGSVGASWPLLEDESWSGLLKNVLHHFGCKSKGAPSNAP